jgi:histidinol-phosphate aminotransferase
LTIATLARPEIRELRSYQLAPSPGDAVRLNANEAPIAIGNGAAAGLNRYPALRPAVLTEKMAAYYGVAADNVLVTRGSSEGIDLLVRTFCAAGKDNVLLTPPVFELYEIYASVQGAGIVTVPLRAESDFSVDVAALLSACDENTKLIFLCSPNNPVGTVIPRELIWQIVRARSGKSVVIIDEAYVEYGDTDSLTPLVREFDNLVVLRTLSKALALAGARCGAVVASAGLIRLLDGVLAPYAVSSPVISSAEQALSGAQLTEAKELVNGIIAERERLRSELATCKAVQFIWPSKANFLLIRFENLQRVGRCLEKAGIAIRTFAADATLDNCARITVASKTDNDRLIAAIRSLD